MTSNAIPEITVTDRPSRVDPATLHPFHRNPRIGDVPLVVESLRENGQYRPLIVNVGTLTGRPDEVLAGNHLRAAGMKLGLSDMLVHWVDVDEERAARIVLIDNRAADQGKYDLDVLGKLLLDFDGNLAGTGYSEGDVQRLLNGLELGDATTITDPDAVPDLPTRGNSRSAPGYVWKLGPHRLVCGDSTDLGTLKALLGDEPADVIWTDPPYGVDYVGKTKDALSIQNDGFPGLAALLFEAFSNAAKVVRAGAPCYIAAPPGPQIITFYAALGEADYLLRQNLVWVKNSMVLGRSDYQYKHEAILQADAPGGEEAEEAPVLEHENVIYGFTGGSTKGRLGRGGPRWYGDHKQTTVIEVPKPTASRVHPTMKPTELITATLRNSAKRGDVVLDLFGGSGSTLIAAHQLNLRARIAEVDPRYCDVICRRFQEATGVMPILESTGKATTFVEGD